MPNHCYNRVTIYGEDLDQIKEIKEKLESEETCFDFNSIIPIPKELVGTTAPPRDPDSSEAKRLRKQHGHDNWYDWCVENWGTKWNSYDSEFIDEDEDRLEYSFNTAWAPPEPIIHKLRELYPDVSITAFYDEPGMELAGYI